MENFYLSQKGEGLSFYSGARYQRGYGWFGRLINKSVLPFIRYMGSKAIETGKNILGDLSSGEDIKTSVKRRAIESLENVSLDAINKLKQSGKGIKKLNQTYIRKVLIQPKRGRGKYNFLK